MTSAAMVAACARYAEGARKLVPDRSHEGGWACILQARLMLLHHAENRDFPVEQTMRLIADRDARLDAYGEPPQAFAREWFADRAAAYRGSRDDVLASLRALYRQVIEPPAEAG